MPTVSAIGTNFNLPNFHGQVHQLTPSDTPFTTVLMGTAPGGGQVDSHRTFEWQTVDLRDADQTTVVDGDRVGTPEHRSRLNVFNVIQTHREDVDVSYERLAQVLQFDGQNIGGGNPITDEEAWQLTQRWKEIKRDIEFSAINGSYVLPADNTTPAQTRGIKEAITTNVIDASGDSGVTPAALTEDMLGDAMQSAYDNGGLAESELGVIVVNSFNKRALTNLFVKDKSLEPRSRNVGGANVQVIETDFGLLSVMLNRYVTQSDLLIVSFEQLRPHFRLVPGKGIMFAEPTSKAGASNATQLYASFGLEYGNEAAHARIEHLTTS